MVVLDAAQSIVTFLGANNIVLAIVGLLAAPFVDRLLIRRNRITYRVLYNSKIGVVPDDPHAADDPARPHSPRFGQLAELLDRMSVVVIRIRNTGSHEVTREDFLHPLSFTFGRRTIWNARISDATNEDLRRRIRDGLEFFTSDTGPREPSPGGGSLRTLRELLPTRFRGEEPGPDWHGVRLRNLTLGRRQRFKLVVVLVDPPDHRGGLIKQITPGGRIRDGLIRDGRIERKITLPRVTGALAVALTLLLVVGAVIVSPPGGPDVGCVAGRLRIEGSSVFMPTMAQLAEQYRRGCPDAEITTQATGSIDGVRALAGQEDGTSNEFAALSDGKQDTAPVVLHSEQVAIVPYHVVVNASAGVDGLSTAQLQGIYNGTYRDWSQLRGGPELPIRIVGRGQESGTRELFEQRVLHGAEPALTSNECLTNDRDPRAAVVRCERNANSEVIAKISQTPGAIGYTDAPSIAEARRQNAVRALTIDNKAFDTSTVIESGYPFWTVEYLYTKHPPVPDTLLASFVEYVRKNDSARVRLGGAGYVPCTTPDGGPLELCNHR
ncbi:PstS family phosphate ABC transporter substrate-binding protein [Pseudonocardia acaciae]|uniref:PstS family phosphate ABC transporter substrate-binding protein n=1 Tax=Pseudonocardia acaciae TaxID=551276 RepID=UPI0004903925|nr:substrate-binding domain-containing protein [Pseudonocardia acaciae]